MMRATLNFTLPDDQDAFDAALLGRRAIGALQEIDRRLRAVVKYGDPTPEVERLVDAVRGMIDEDFLDA